MFRIKKKAFNYSCNYIQAAEIRGHDMARCLQLTFLTRKYLWTPMDIMPIKRKTVA